jgi:uncharacterized protein YeaO (DUF488 family)
MNNPGKLFTSNPRGLKNLTVEAEIWQITRGKTIIPNTVLVRGLAPSKELFAKFLGKWKQLDPKMWWEEYEELFLSELKTEEKKSMLRVLYSSIKSGKNVVLLCFCKDARFCHRRLVGQFMAEHGTEVIELDLPGRARQLTIF